MKLEDKAGADAANSSEKEAPLSLLSKTVVPEPAAVAPAASNPAADDATTAQYAVVRKALKKPRSLPENQPGELIPPSRGEVRRTTLPLFWSSLAGPGDMGKKKIDITIFRGTIFDNDLSQCVSIFICVSISSKVNTSTVSYSLYVHDCMWPIFTQELNVPNGVTQDDSAQPDHSSAGACGGDGFTADVQYARVNKPPRPQGNKMSKATVVYGGTGDRTWDFRLPRSLPLCQEGYFIWQGRGISSCSAMSMPTVQTHISNGPHL